MAGEDVNIRFGGSIDGLEAAAKEAVEVTEEMLAPINNITAAATKMGEAWAGAFAVEKVLQMTEAAVEYGDKLHKANEETGISVENLSALEVAADHADVSFDTLQRGLGHFAQSIQAGIAGTGAQAKAFSALGITQDELKAKGNDSAAVLELVAQKLDQFGAGANKEAIVMALFGARLRDIQPILTDLAQNGMEGLRQKAAEVGLLFDGDFAEAMKHAHDASKDYEETSKSLGIELSAHLLPAITAVERALTQLFGSHESNQQRDLEGLEAQADLLTGKINEIKTKLQSESGLSHWLDSSHLANYNQMLDKTREQIQEITWAQLQAGTTQKLTVKPLNIPDSMKMDAPSIGADGAAGGDGAAQSRVAAWRDQLDQKLMAEKSYFADSKGEELAFWQSKIGLTTQGSQEQLAVERNIYTLSKELAQQKRNETDAIAKDDADTQLTIGKMKLQAERDELSAEVDAHKITADQKVDILRKLSDQEYQLDLQSLQNELAALSGQPAAYEKVYDQILVLKQKHVGEMAALDRQAADAQKQQLAQATTTWEKALQPIDNAFKQSITGMIQGTQTGSQAISRLFSSIVASLVGDVEEMVTKWAAGELAKTAATQGGVLAQIAAWITGDTAAKAASTTNAVSQITSAGAVTYANAFAAISAIPYVGPELAPAGAAAAEASMLAVALPQASAAQGMWRLPTDMTIAAHAEESILPAAIASPMRSFFENGAAGQGGNTTHNNIDMSGMTVNGRMNARDIANFKGAVISAIREAQRGLSFA